ncbi:MAG: carboxypeptidase regulatory-like domain-containing protein [Reichenbachiella sp.]|uniref:carboxypeptidase regulatory-like domain-containing protein n=1 Tax=Reichenbachiella sp. TaxID=2184521 RepID=UPI0032970987
MSMYKKIIFIIVYLFLSVLLFVATASAQDDAASKPSKFKLNNYRRTKERAAKYFDDLAYRKGIEVYKKAFEQLPTDDTLKVKIADGYYQIQEMDSAQRWYSEVIDRPELIVEDRHYINYAEALIYQGKYVEAKTWFEKFEANNPEDKRIKLRLDGLERQLTFYRDSIRFEVWNAPFNSEGYDFSPTFYQDGLIMVSSRRTANMTQFLKAKYDWDDTYFLNLFSVDSNNEVNEFNRRLKTSYHEGPVAFYENDTKVIFTRNSYEKGEVRVSNKKLSVQSSKVNESKSGEVNLKLFYSEIEENGKWSTPVELWFNDANISSGHPTVSRDGQRLYFASNREGGLGETDLYMCHWRNGVWGEPENLGNKINTEGSEMFPFISEDDILYFASNGHMGLGGLDLFEVDLKNEHAKPQNLGYPMNTASDDFGICIQSKGSDQYGYISSNRPGGKGLDDIYAFQYSQHRSIPGQVVDLLTGLPVDNASVQVVNAAGDTVEQALTFSNGTFNFEYDMDHRFTVLAGKSDYSKDMSRFSPQQWPEGDTLVLRIMKDRLVVRGTITDEVRGDSLAQARVIVTNETTGEKFGIVTEADGAYSFLGHPNSTYSFMFKKYRYFSETDRLEIGDQHNGEIIFDRDLEKIIIGKPIGLNDIHFDLAKWDIRPDAAVELDKFTETLMENPSIIVELSTHTDSRGGDQYNFDLSDKRAKSSADYVAAHGVDHARILGQGYGESHLVNNCSNGIRCPESEHQKNRRAEFMITGFLPDALTEEEKKLLWIDADYISEHMSDEDRKEFVLVEQNSTGPTLLSGQVKDAMGNALKDAVVTMVVKGAHRATQVYTDEQGNFELRVNSHAIYKLIVQQDEFMDEGILVEIEDESIMDLSIQLVGRGDEEGDKEG